MNCLKRSTESLLTMYRLCMLTFRKRAKVAYQIRTCIESANNHVEETAKQTTAEGAKGRKRGPYKLCLVSFSSYYLHCTSPTPSHVQSKISIIFGRSDNVSCLHGCCGAVVITKICGDHEIFITKIFNYGIFSNFTKIWSYTVL